MNQPAIRFDQLSKQYRLGVIGTGTLSHDLKRWWTVSIRGEDDPYLKIGLANQVKPVPGNDFIWALRNISFEVSTGEVLGIIGKNGAGKSTLLKILSRITSPTTGRICTRGRIASLLEVGTGFHPEMTGRENIYLNGAIMGMTKNEINRKFDEIVSFSEVEKYIDTPVKRYSSGMTVRLGFAIAAHLDPEILVLDEVLAVGDAEFQKKAIGKIRDVSSNEGRTVLFVSHNMAAVKRLCNKCIVLKDGEVSFSGLVEEGIEKYLQTHQITADRIINRISFCHPDLKIHNIRVNGLEDNFVLVRSGDDILKISISGYLKAGKKMSLHLLLYDDNNNVVASYHPSLLYGDIKTFGEGEFLIEEDILLPDNLIKGTYTAELSLAYPLLEYYMISRNSFRLDIEGISTMITCDLNYSSGGVILLRDAKKALIKGDF
ncbi:MAG: ABC transporter ATP-binding protein [Bacteroidales bacterium]